MGDSTLCNGHYYVTIWTIAISLRRTRAQEHFTIGPIDKFTNKKSIDCQTVPKPWVFIGDNTFKRFSLTNWPNSFHGF